MRRGDAGGVGEELDQPGARRRVRFAGGDRTLLGRAVHEHAAAELGAQADQSRHDLERSRPHRGVGIGQRQAGRPDQQPVQAGDDEAGRLDDAADPLRLDGVDAMRRIGERERRDLEAVVAERGGELALLLERHRR